MSIRKALALVAVVAAVAVGTRAIASSEPAYWQVEHCMGGPESNLRITWTPSVLDPSLVELSAEVTIGAENVLESFELQVADDENEDGEPDGGWTTVSIGSITHPPGQDVASAAGVMVSAANLRRVRQVRGDLGECFDSIGCISGTARGGEGKHRPTVPSIKVEWKDNGDGTSTITVTPGNDGGCESTFRLSGGGKSSTGTSGNGEGGSSASITVKSTVTTAEVDFMVTGISVLVKTLTLVKS